MNTRRVMAVGAVGGMLAGMMMAMTEMVYGWISSAHTFWDAPMAIWAWVAGLDWFGAPGDNIWSIILGMGGHMTNSMIAGVMFAAVATLLRLRGLATLVTAGVAYGLGLWAIMRYGILPLNDPESTLFTTDLVSPQWVWWLAHAILGMTAGVFFYLVSRRLAARPLEHSELRHLRRAA
ncbi:MAG: hypothetical protein ICV67_02945 [Thermoleophilia bacterium]|nr:hypothetical protein [Thermoleophilia bacterium]